MLMEKGLKRRKGDGISELPESILLHILSFLNMNEVVKTSVLSKQWEYIWTSVPTLTFEYDEFSYKSSKKIVEFVRWVSNTLLQCENTAIRKLDIKFPYMEEFADDVNVWMKFVARNKIQDLSLECIDKLPRSLCHNSSLSSLSISQCTLALSIEICWTSLRNLSIDCMGLDDDIMTKILSGTPMLQVLKIIYCNSDIIHIKSDSLRELVIDSFMSESLIEISAPNIQSLRILGHDFTGKLVLCSSSLFRAELDFLFNDNDTEKERRSNFMTIMENILPVVQLEVGSYFHQNLSLLGNNSLSSPFLSLTCLKFTGIMDKKDIVGIICLLKCSPNLEKLVVNKVDNYSYKCHAQNQSLLKIAGEYWESEKRMEKIELPYLKTVKFNGFREVDEFTSVLLQLLRENAPLLDNIVINM